MALENIDGAQDERLVDPREGGSQSFEDQYGVRDSLTPLATNLARMMRPSAILPRQVSQLGQADVQRQQGTLRQPQSGKPTIGQRILALVPRPVGLEPPTINQARLGGQSSTTADPLPAKLTSGNLRLQRSRRSGGADNSSGQPSDGTPLGHIQVGAGPVESNATAWNAFMKGLDEKRVGDFTVGELANVLTNESRDLSFIGPTISLFDNDLDHAKYVQAHAILNNALRRAPNGMANRTVTKGAAASRGRDRDVAIMRQAYFDRMTKGADPAQGRTYFGNSADVLKSRPIGNSRQTPFARFGPFALGRQQPQHIYIFNDPIQMPAKKKEKH